MVFDSLEQYSRYSGFGFNIPAALKFLMENDLSALPVGRVEIDGSNLFALVQEYLTKPFEEGQWEAHRKYIDVQHMVIGKERMGFANIRTMQLGEYVPEKDFQPMAGGGNQVVVPAGYFAIFFPDDGHMPGLVVDAPERIKKVVLKVRI